MLRVKLADSDSKPRAGFEDPYSSALTWDVDWGDGTPHGTATTANTAQITHTYTTPGTYAIHYSATDNDGTGGANPNRTTRGEPILVIAAANPPPINVSWSASVGSLAPVNQAVTFTGFANDPEDTGGIAKYEWDWNGDGVYDDQSADNNGMSQIAHTFTQPGAIALTCRTSSGNWSASDTKILAIKVGSAQAQGVSG